MALPLSDKTDTYGSRRSISSDGVIYWHKQIFIVVLTFFPFLLLKVELKLEKHPFCKLSLLWFSEFVLITQWAQVN
jgi:hypothetical protein